MTHNFTGLQNACKNCPFVAVVDADMCGLAKQTIMNPHEQRAVAEVAASHMLNVQDVEIMAGRIGCRDIPKDLPETPNPMPPLGSTERIAYGRLCPAYLAIKQMHQAEYN